RPEPPRPRSHPAPVHARTPAARQAPSFSQPCPEFPSPKAASANVRVMYLKGGSMSGFFNRSGCGAGYWPLLAAALGPSAEWQVLARKGLKPRVGFQVSSVRHSAAATGWIEDIWRDCQMIRSYRDASEGVDLTLRKGGSVVQGAARS